MNQLTSRSGARLFGRLLFSGQRVDRKYAVVMILVVTGMFSTPLALGSIRNRVYVALKAQIEKENNAREIRLQTLGEKAPPLDEQIRQQIRTELPEVVVVGNHKLVVSAEGPAGADLLTLQTLEPNDPRLVPLQVRPELPPTLAMSDLIVSDTLGQLLYGEAWHGLWNTETGRFEGPPLRLRIHDLPLAQEFRPIARRLLPGRGLYGSPALGAELRQYTLGFGSSTLGLPLDEDLAAASLPQPVSTRCRVLLLDDDPSCDVEGEGRLRRRFAELQLALEPLASSSFPGLEGARGLDVTLTGGTPSDCAAFLTPHLVGHCDRAVIVPNLGIEVELSRDRSRSRPIRIEALTNVGLERLPSYARLRDTLGIAPESADFLELTLPHGAGFNLGESLEIAVSSARIPARVRGFYECSAPSVCPALADSEKVFRLRNLADGTIRVVSRQPLRFAPTRLGTDFDELLVYTSGVETVKATSHRLQALFPDYSVQFNAAALDKLERQDARLATLFSLTMVLSALFLILALGALARINIERRNRQMAQMLILGFSRRFVHRLVVAEYLLLTFLGSLCALAMTALLCRLARALLPAVNGETGNRDFEMILQAMSIDPGAFALVLGVVSLCSGAIALVAAHRAARSNPLDLLE